MYDKYVINNNILSNDQKDNALHVFYAGCGTPATGVPNYSIGGVTSGVPNLDERDFIILKGVYQGHVVDGDEQAVWITRRTMAHELGHAMGLHHSYLSNDQCADTAPSASTIPNNIMSDAHVKGSLTECQLSRMHFYLTDERCITNIGCSSIHKKVIKNYCEIQPGEDIKIKSGETYTWTSEKKLTGNLIIESGGRLTIKCKIGMPKDGRIIVQKNAELIVDGGTITNNCAGTVWKGIFVEGDATKDQHEVNGNRHQGYLGLRDATLENSRTAVGLWDGNTSAKAGGVVNATTSVFLNNWRDVEFRRYTNKHINDPNQDADNLSRFVKCEFLTNDDYYLHASDDPLSRVTMHRVDGIRFRGCKFENSSSAQGFKGKGMYTIDANFRVEALGSTPSIFNGFKFGIEALNQLDLHNYTVRNAQFIGNRTGIYNSGVNSSMVTNCSFEVGNTNTQVSQNHGIYLNGGTGYIIEENTFVGTHAPFVNKIGIVARATGTDWNSIYKNDFARMDFANLSNGDNRGGAATGLKYECNQNSQNRFDFSVPLENGNFGISEVQSGPFDPAIQGNLPAGNVFTPILFAPLVSQFSNMGEELDYLASGISTTNGEIPNNNFILGVNLDVISSVNTCADHMFTDGDPQLAEGEKEQLKGQFSYHLNILNELKKSVASTAEESAEISGHANKVYTAANILVYDLLADSTNTELDSLRAWWANKNSLDSEYNIIKSYAAQKDTNTAKQLTLAIPLNRVLSTQQELDYNNFKAMQRIEFDLIKTDRNWTELETPEIITLLTIAEDEEGRAGIRAQNVLSFHYGFDYFREAILPEFSAQGNEDEESTKTATHLWNAYPNPATNEVIIQYNIPEKAKTLYF
jgi:hypothetical protein